ncbi:hypothetical protein NU195Hw_g3000t1 [Hortaea werneckii]
MPGCIFNHLHSPWPTVGPLTICDGERTCGFCKGPGATIKYADAANLRKHVYHTHTDGGSRDQRSVEVLMYRPWIRAAGDEATDEAEGAALLAERTPSPSGHAQTTGHEPFSTAVSAVNSTGAGQPAPPTRPKKWVSEAGKASHRRRMAEIKKKARKAKEAKEATEAEEATEAAE